MVKFNPPKRIRAHGTPREAVSRPSNGGSLGYSVAHRIETLHLHAIGVNHTASKASVYRWKHRLIPLLSTGNKATRKLSGIHRFLLLRYRSIFPRCNADEMRRFLYEASVPNVLFSRSDIYNAEKELNITRKRASTTAAQASLPHNLIRRRLFWTMPPPGGVLGVNRLALIDIDECALYLQIVNRPYGKSYINTRVREEGPYGHDLKFTLILAISCDGFKHVRLRQVSGSCVVLLIIYGTQSHHLFDTGTTGPVFLEFINNLLARLPPIPGRIFLWDNLSSHNNGEVAHRIYTAGHSIITRPAYSPTDGPIEYIFNCVERSLQSRMYSIRNIQSLQWHIYDIIGKITAQHITNTFVHCGY